MTPLSEPRSLAGSFRELAAALAEASWDFHRRGWAVGTSGNFSAVLSSDPLRLVITGSGLDKGALTVAKLLEIDGDLRVVQGKGLPSAEALLHVTLVRVRSAGAVLHTHSVWSTIVSEMHSPQGGVDLSGFEMLKGLHGVTTHEHRERLPILENSQDMPALARRLEATLEEHPLSHGFLVRRHGLYTWGRDVAEARRHVEILEFLLEVVGRTRDAAGRRGEK